MLIVLSFTAALCHAQLRYVPRVAMPQWISQDSVLLWIQTEGPEPELQALKSKKGHTIKPDTLLSPYAIYLYALAVPKDGLHLLWRARPEATEKEVLHINPFPKDSMVVLAGSCSYMVDAPRDRPGKPYGGGYNIYESMAAQQADLMLWLGDQVYLRNKEWDTLNAIRTRYRKDRSPDSLQAFLQSTRHIGIWDDHDFGPNDADGSYLLKDSSLEVFNAFWPNGIYRNESQNRYWYRKVVLPQADLFLLDNRSFRKAKGPIEERCILGETQLRWLTQSLLASTAKVKLVAMGGQFLNDAKVYETYANIAPHEREALITFILEHKIKGVVFIDGDRHHTEFCSIENGTIYDWTISPLNSGTHPFPEEHNTLREPGSLVSERNYGRLVMLPDGKLRLSIHLADGKEVWRKELQF